MFFCSREFATQEFNNSRSFIKNFLCFFLCLREDTFPSSTQGRVGNISWKIYSILSETKLLSWKMYSYIIKVFHRRSNDRAQTQKFDVSFFPRH